ncbi:FkbM family methyltransferase [Coraliomargarita parva]|uniref:FkbM family methyltransferase n=1 Tax=Coraliomargarita parva TaxID=3014050 RepID=UPI0022B2DC30|nr:FkbM family methyltransferase [Coraliomargarita parva]
MSSQTNPLHAVLRSISRILPLGLGAGFAPRLRACCIRLLYPRNRVRVDDMTIVFHSPNEYIAQQCIHHGGYEKELIGFLCSQIKPGDTVLDVGANIGLHTLKLSRAVGEEGRVLAFEPDPANVRLLRKNLELNRCTNVEVFPFALGATAGLAKLYLCRENKGWQSFANLSDSTQSIEVEVKRIDEVLPKGLKPAFMKMDVEGAEPLVLEGMHPWPDQFVFEFVHRQVCALGHNPLAFLQSFNSRGYELFRVDTGVPEAATPEDIARTAEQTGSDYNLLARKAGFA